MSWTCKHVCDIYIYISSCMFMHIRAFDLISSWIALSFADFSCSSSSRSVCRATSVVGNWFGEHGRSVSWCSSANIKRESETTVIAGCSSPTDKPRFKNKHAPIISFKNNKPNNQTTFHVAIVAEVQPQMPLLYIYMYASAIYGKHLWWHDDI